MKITIITINYNNLYGLIKTIESVFSQIFTDYQFFIIDGGSNDGSKEYIEAHSNNIDYWVSEKDNGVYHAMNKGLAKATGEYCIFLNSGDYLANNMVLENLFDLVDFDSSIIYGTLNWENSNDYWVPKKDLKIFEFIFHTPFSHQATIYRTKDLKSIGGYKENYLVISDWITMIKFYELRKINQKVELLISIGEKQGISLNFKNRIFKERMHYLLKYSKYNLILGVLFLVKKKCFGFFRR